MASQLTKNYVYKVLETLSNILQTDKIDDLSSENLKRIIDNSNILNTKLKTTNKKRISGWHAYVSKHRKNLSMVDMAEKWKNISKDEKKIYNEIALNIRESYKEISFKNNENDSNIYSNNNTKWNIFKKSEIKLGNTNLNNIKDKFSTLTKEEMDKL
jgi:hypothetical protein